jgi:VWFA-related protein
MPQKDLPKQNEAMGSNAWLQHLTGLSILVSSIACAQSMPVSAIVTDKEFKPVSDLRKEQFDLRVDGKETSLNDFRKDTAPVSVVIVLDASSNMKSVLEQSQATLQKFFTRARPDDEYALVVSQGYKKSWVEVPFTSDPDRIRKGFSNVTADGAAPLFDSLETALDLVKQGKNAHRVILAIADGFDTRSQTKFKKLRSDVLESNASLYGLEVFAGRAHEDVDSETLKELVELSGGVFFDDVSAKQFAEYFGNLDPHQRYVLTFQTSGVGHDHKQHWLDVRIHGTESTKSKVFWRHAYLDASLPKGN